MKRTYETDNGWVIDLSWIDMIGAPLFSLEDEGRWRVPFRRRGVTTAQSLTFACQEDAELFRVRVISMMEACNDR